MKLAYLFFVFGLFIQSNWESFVSLNGRFKVMSPNPLIEQVDTVQTAVGDLVYHTFFLEKEVDKRSKQLIYMVSYCDYPEGIVFADSLDLVEEFFSETMMAAAETVKGDVVYSTDIQLGENPGKFWRINFQGGEAIAKTKAYLVGNRYYSIQVIASKEQNMTEPSNRFLDSFELL